MLKQKQRVKRQSFKPIILMGLMLMAAVTLASSALAQQAFIAHPPASGMSGEALMGKLLEHNQQRESGLRQYSSTRTYRIANSKGKVRAESEVALEYRASSGKVFKTVSEKGSGFVRGRVFKPLMESEIEAAAGRSRHDSSITPDNYTFELLGEEDVDGHHCYVAKAIPKRKAKYLFNGKIWIHTTDFAVVKIEGQPAQNPSFWIKRVDFVRRYQKVGKFWLPLKDESTSQVRVVGAHVLTINYGNYQIGQN
ncbi:outer membrane lipoprotein-sorting protein [candidate division KSB1 bacterium]|nr:outer membrane lipoprotein-sorting protein [candidate division KSB1 bacterium]